MKLGFGLAFSKSKYPSISTVCLFSLYVFLFFKMTSMDCRINDFIVNQNPTFFCLAWQDRFKGFSGQKWCAHALNIITISMYVCIGMKRLCSDTKMSHKIKYVNPEVKVHCNILSCLKSSVKVKWHKCPSLDKFEVIREQEPE